MNVAELHELWMKTEPKHQKHVYDGYEPELIEYGVLREKPMDLDQKEMRYLG